MYYSQRNDHRCILEGQAGPPEPGEITEAQVRKHKGLSKEQFKTEKTKSLRFIKRGLVINRFCEWIDSRPSSWFHMSTGYDDPKLQRFIINLKRSWPWNIETCKWTPGKILMALREQSWADFEKHQNFSVREPHLRVLKLSVEEASIINRRFASAYKRAINQLGAKNGTTANL